MSDKMFNNHARTIKQATYEFRVLPDQLAVIDNGWRDLSQSNISALHSGKTPSGAAILRELRTGVTVSTTVDGVKREFRRRQ